MTTKTDWLEAALNQLIEQGVSSVKVERLARGLEVTKGSFYWHFKDRPDLLQQTAEFWAEGQRAFLAAQGESEHKLPADRLKALIEFISVKDTRPDVAIRLWARQADWVDEIVSTIDRLRIEYCERMFVDMGFCEEDAQLRARLVYYYQVAEQTVSYQLLPDARRKLDWRRIKLLMQQP